MWHRELGESVDPHSMACMLACMKGCATASSSGVEPHSSGASQRGMGEMRRASRIASGRVAFRVAPCRLSRTSRARRHHRHRHTASQRHQSAVLEAAQVAEGAVRAPRCEPESAGFRRYFRPMASLRVFHRSHALADVAIGAATRESSVTGRGDVRVRQRLSAVSLWTSTRRLGLQKLHASDG